MRIRRIPTGGFSGKDWAATGPGKGSAPRNVSDQFKANYETIRWNHDPAPPSGYTRIVWRDGKREVLTR
jgi:hypothetical protein